MNLEGRVNAKVVVAVASEVVEGNGENDKWKWEGVRDAHWAWFSDTLLRLA